MKAEDRLRLLPYYWKWIASALLIVALLLLGLSAMDILSEGFAGVKFVAKDIALLALVLLAITRDKDEDEMTIQIRLSAFTASFIYGCGFVILFPLVDLLIGGKLYFSMGSYQLLLTMLIFYFIVYYLAKSRR